MRGYSQGSRSASGDPKALEERYKDRDGYVKAIKQAAQKLVQKLVEEEFLLEEDANRFINHHCRVAANGAAPPGAEAVHGDSDVRPSTRWGCLRTGPDRDGTESSKTRH